MELQQRLNEVEVQAVRERLRGLRLAAEGKDLDLRFHESSANIHRLLAARYGERSGAVAAIGASGGSIAAGAIPAANSPAALCAASSGCVLRSVATPNDSGADSRTQMAEVWQEIEAEVRGHAEDVETLDAARIAVAGRKRRAAAAAQAALREEQAALEAERERLAESLAGYVRLRAKHLTAQRRAAEEEQALRIHNEDLARRAEAVAQAGRQEPLELEISARREAAGHADFRRRAETLERQNAFTLCQRLEVVQAEGEARSAVLLSELGSLQEKCAEHRRRRHQALTGLRADLSLVTKKLLVLEAVSKTVSENGDCEAVSHTPEPRAVPRRRRAPRGAGSRGARQR